MDNTVTFRRFMPKANNSIINDDDRDGIDSDVFSERGNDPEFCVSDFKQPSTSNGPAQHCLNSTSTFNNQLTSNNTNRRPNSIIEQNRYSTDHMVQNSTLPNTKDMPRSITRPDSLISVISANSVSRFPLLNDRCHSKENIPKPTHPSAILPSRSLINSQISFCSIDSLNNNSNRGNNTPISPTDHKSLSYATTIDTPATAPGIKKRKFLDKIFTTLGIIYALLIITIGVALYLLDYIDLQRQELHFIAEWFSLTILTLAMVYFFYITIDINNYMNKTKQLTKLMEEIPMEQLECQQTSDTSNQNHYKMQQILELNKILNRHSYCFNKDRHSSNFYLKIGATAFCFGHLIHSILILTYRGIILSSSDQATEGCVSQLTYAIDVMYPIYSLLLLFFIFKYSSVIINKNVSFHRIGFLHCIATNLCCWIWTIFRETAEYVQYHDQKTYSTNMSVEDSKSINMITPRRFTTTCDNADLNVLYQNYSPYLYPFSVEYSIIIVGILYITWTNIGLCLSTTILDHTNETRQCKNHETIGEDGDSNMTLQVDCHASNRGFFSGFIVLVFAIGSVILFFITFFHDENDLAELGRVISESTQTAILALMSVCSVWAYMQLYKLDINEFIHNQLDNFLLVMCLPAFFIYSIFSITAASFYSNKLAILRNSAELIQILIQTPLTIDALSKSSNSKQLRKLKPGRALIIFLVICNIAMWLMLTFEVKSHGLNQYRQEFYSKEFWSIVGHMCLPLIMFYRFHSSACLCDVWKYAYVPAGH